MAALDDLIAELERSYTETRDRLSDPAVYNDHHEAADVGRRLKQLEGPYNLSQQWRQARADLEAARGDVELGEMVDDYEAEVARLEEELKLALAERDPADDKDVIVEIRQGVGGDEAALWAAELQRMLQRYAERRGFKFEQIETNANDGGGLKEGVFAIKGDGAYSVFKFEGGTHRVQRVPETESAGRIHTSTATVAVMPEAEDAEVEIDDSDLKIDVYRSSGPGGQSVNTTDSAVRITHLETGLVVEIQDEKSQHKNKAKAMSVLRSRLYERELAKQREADSAARRSMVGGGDRSEKIRTYNFPQDRLTDHRIGLDLSALPRVMDGDIDRLIDALVMADQADRLASITGGDDDEAN
jgi:peptide chain release factor 1